LNENISKMRESTSSKEPLSPSDHERSFERTRDSYIACINRSLDHAFEFLSETGYASAGYSDAERVESRSEDELDRSQSDFVSEINIGLKQCGVKEIGGTPLDDIKEVRLGQLWAPSKKVIGTSGDSKGNVNQRTPYARRETIDTEYLNSRNRLHSAEESYGTERSQKKVIVYQHMNTGNHRKHKSRSMENIGSNCAIKNGDRRNTQRDAEIKRFVMERRPNGKENAAPKSKLHEREDSGYESKAEMRNGVDAVGLTNGSLKEKNRPMSDTQRTLEIYRREIMPYLTTEREIFKQIITNAKESEQIVNKHRRRSRSLSNLDLRRSASRASLSPTPRGRPSPIAVPNQKKGFRKFRESFKKTTSFFMPQKFAVHQEKDAESDFTNALEFQYHCMRNSRDGNEPITSLKNLEGKKKGFFKGFFGRKKGRPRLQRFFKSTEAISQTRWQSRENLSKNERKSKGERPISMLTDKVKEQAEATNVTDSNVGTLDDIMHQTRRNSFKGSRFRRCESLRSIPSPSYSSGLNEMRTNDISEPSRYGRSNRSRPISVHGVLFRAMSLDASEDRAESSDYQNLHRVLRNRLSCCSINDNAFHNCANNRMSLDRMSLDSRGTHDEVFTSSSPRKNDDITEWIRGLQFSSINRTGQNHDCFDEELEINLIEEETLLNDNPENGDGFCPETRIINGQKQTYL